MVSLYLLLRDIVVIMHVLTSMWLSWRQVFRVIDIRQSFRYVLPIGLNSQCFSLVDVDVVIWYWTYHIFAYFMSQLCFPLVLSCVHPFACIQISFSYVLFRFYFLYTNTLKIWIMLALINYMNGYGIILLTYKLQFLGGDTDNELEM